MKEKDVKQKWCPFARVPSRPATELIVSANRTFNGEMDLEARCLGSDCACWVDNTPYTPSGNNESTGYCGLANK